MDPAPNAMADLEQVWQPKDRWRQFVGLPMVALTQIERGAALED